jgi:orotidine-5'-phosphate decarboxylase
MGSMPSGRDIPARERLIVPLDVRTHDEAHALVDRLGDSAVFYKVGFQLLLGGDPVVLVRTLRDRGKKVFLDLKLYDIPQTVSSAVEQLAGLGVTYATVHGVDPLLEAACAVKDDVGILAVTVITSFDDDDVAAMGYAMGAQELVLMRAGRALELGADGVVASGREVANVRSEHGDKLVIVVPGVRPGHERTDDQKRTVTVREAFEAGADHVVVGRPIRDATDPKAAAEAIQATIVEVLR